MLVNRKDKEATKKMGFFNPKSYVTFAGKEFRKGEDMEHMRLKVFERSKGYCEMPLWEPLMHNSKLMGISVCHGICQRNISWETFEMHHKIHRSKGGDDSFENLVASCRRCHVSHHGRTLRWTKGNAQ